MQSFAQFGSDLDDSTKKILNHGERVTELLKQPQYSPMSLVDQVLSLFAIKNGFMDELPVEEVSSFEKTLHRTFHDEYADLCNAISEKGDLTPEMTEQISDGMKKALEQFKLAKGVN